MYIYTVFLNSVYIYMYMYVFAALTSHRTPSVWLNELPPWEATWTTARLSKYIGDMREFACLHSMSRKSKYKEI